jgi:hypothetical protein
MSIAVGGGVTFAGITTFHSNVDLGSNSLEGSLQVATGATISGSTNTITGSTNGSERFRVSNDGTFRVGTDSSNVQIATNSGLDINDGSINLYQATTNVNAAPFIISSDVGGTETEKLRFTARGRLGIGTDDPLMTVHIHSSNTGGDLQIDRVGNNANGPELVFRHISETPADNDYVGQIAFSGRDDANNNTTVARIDGIMTDVTNGSEDGELVFNTRSNGSFAERMRLTSAGNLKLASGNGIDFHNYGNGTNIDSNLLDDYEEGTFTPTIQTTTTGGQQSMVNAYYTKIGRIVVAHAQYSFPTGFGLGDLTIRNLPFTANSAGSGAGAIFQWQDGGGFAGGMGRITAGGTTAERFGATASPSGSFSGNIWFTFTYTAA